MMTTMAAIFGALPIALGFGTGAEAHRPLGIIIIGRPRRLPARDALLSDSCHLPLSGESAEWAEERAILFLRIIDSNRDRPLRGNC